MTTRDQLNYATGKLGRGKNQTLYTLMEWYLSYMTKVRHRTVHIICFHLCKEVESYVHRTCLKEAQGTGTTGC